MSWRKYLFYLTIDGKSKGYHDIDSTLVDVEPTKCVFGHDINTKRTKIIIKKKREKNSKKSEESNEALAESDEFRTDSE